MLMAIESPNMFGPNAPFGSGGGAGFASGVGFNEFLPLSDGDVIEGVSLFGGVAIPILNERIEWIKNEELNILEKVFASGQEISDGQIVIDFSLFEAEIARVLGDESGVEWLFEQDEKTQDTAAMAALAMASMGSNDENFKGAANNLLLVMTGEGDEFSKPGMDKGPLAFRTLDRAAKVFGNVLFAAVGIGLLIGKQAVEDAIEDETRSPEEEEEEIKRLAKRMLENNADRATILESWNQLKKKVGSLRAVYAILKVQAVFERDGSFASSGSVRERVDLDVDSVEPFAKAE